MSRGSLGADRNADRVVRSWLHEDRHEDATRVLDTVLTEVDTTPQRRSGGMAWRFLLMNNNIVRVGLAAAAVVVIAIIAINLLPGSPQPGGAPTPSPSVEPSAAESLTPAGLPEGPHLLHDGLSQGTVAMTVTIPAPGWYGEPSGGILTKNENADPPDGAGMIVWAGVENLYVYGDPCAWSTTRPDSPATTVDEAMAALAAQASRDASAPVDITLDGYTGKAITLHTPDDANFAECDEGLFGMFADDVESGPDSVERYSQGPGQIDEVWILDVDGQLVVIDWTYYAETPQASVDEERAIVESTTFGN
jgi:hypothetical protein